MECKLCNDHGIKRKAKGKFLMLDGQKYPLCETCAKGLKPASWLKRRTYKEKLLILHVSIIAAVAIAAFLLLIYVFRAPEPSRTL